MAAIAASGRIERPSVFKRLGCQNRIFKPPVVNMVCKYWLQGRCVRNPCRFMHPPLPLPNKSKSWKNPDTYKKPLKNLTKDHEFPPKVKVVVDDHNLLLDDDDQCKNDQTKVVLDQSQLNNTNDQDHHKKKKKRTGLSILARLEGHTMGVTGIVCVSGSGKLYCATMDKSLSVWDCYSGQCDSVLPLDTHCAILVQLGSWMFAGLQNHIMYWNFTTQSQGTIQGYGGGQVHAIAIAMSQDTDTDTLFAGMEVGTILSWTKSTSDTTFSPEPTAVLKGHTGSVLSLLVIGQMLYSGSSDHSIRAWTVDSLECRYVFNGHTGDVTTLLCYDRFLFSGSLDKTIKVWGHAENANVVQVYTHNVDDAVLAFRGMHDAENNPMLICLCRNSGVHMYYLPSFAEMGSIVSAHAIQAIQVGPQGLFFTGDAAGVVTVWKTSAESESESDDDSK